MMGRRIGEPVDVNVYIIYELVEVRRINFAHCDQLSAGEPVGKTELMPLDVVTREERKAEAIVGAIII